MQQVVDWQRIKKLLFIDWMYFYHQVKILHNNTLFPHKTLKNFSGEKTPMMPRPRPRCSRLLCLSLPNNTKFWICHYMQHATTTQAKKNII